MHCGSHQLCTAITNNTDNIGDVLCNIFVFCVYQQLTQILEETQFDISADAVLHRVCINELKEHCSDVPTGEGRSKSYVL